MTPFAYAKPADIEQALGLVGPGSRYIAGGTSLLGLMRENVARPRRLIDITDLPLRDIRRTPTGGLLAGALVSNIELAWNPAVETDYPLLTQAILADASPQLRNMASTGGNLLQRTRCQYFHDAGTPCNKRKPGSGCPARSKLNRNHTILGASEHCVTVYPSDLCMALAALETQVLMRDRAGERRVAFANFHRLPADTPEHDNYLTVDKLVTAIELPAPRFARHCHYLKVRDRASYAFTLASVTAILEPDGERIGELRLALGGVAHKPWRVAGLEEHFRDHPASQDNYARFTEALLRNTKSLTYNAFKTGLARSAIVRALGGTHSGEIGQWAACHAAPNKP